MKHPFQHFAALSLTCALFGATLAGCNQSGDGGGTSMMGAPVGAASDTLATVGTAKITRANLNQFLEANGGEQALPIMIDTQLVFEALKAKSLDVSDAEVEADLTRRQVGDPAVAKLVTEGGARLALIKTQIRRELAVQKLLTAGITPTDAQVKSFFEKNRRYYDQASKVTFGMLLSATKTRANLMAEQLKKKSKNLAQLVAEQKKAADPLGSQSVEDVTQSQIWPQIAQIAPDIKPAVEKLPQGGATPVRTFAPTAFGIFVVATKTAPVKADLTKMRAEVEADYKSAEVAKKTVETARKAAEKNPQLPPNPASFDENVRRSYESLRAQNPNATLRDTLNFINQVTANELISGLRTAGTVQVEDAAYAKVAEPYQPKTAAGDPAGNTATGNAATGNAATGNAATGNAASATAAP